MGKTLRELSSDLMEFIVNMHNSAHETGGFKKQRYNNLKVDVMDPRLTRTPQAKITIGISESVYDLVTLQKISGGLGPDERFIQRWLGKESVLADLNEAWKKAEHQVGKAQGADN